MADSEDLKLQEQIKEIKSSVTEEHMETSYNIVLLLSDPGKTRNAIKSMKIEQLNIFLTASCEALFSLPILFSLMGDLEKDFPDPVFFKKIRDDNDFIFDLLNTLYKAVQEEKPNFKPVDPGPDVTEEYKAAYQNDLKIFHSIVSFLTELKKRLDNHKRKTAKKITTTRPEKLDFPLDKLNSVVWNLGEGRTGKEIKLKTGDKKGADVKLVYSIDFENFPEGIKLSRALTPFDYKVYLAAGSAYNAGNKEGFTLTQVYHAMGGSSDPSPAQLKKINDSITKMGYARVMTDNTAEIEAGFKYPKFIYDSYLLPMERITAEVNGKITDSVIHLFREPPLITFARERKQLVTIPIKMLQVPVSNTDAIILIENYLINRIAHAKNPKGQRKILFSRIFEKANITDPQQKKRLKRKIRIILDFYKTDCEAITDWTEFPDGVKVSFSASQTKADHKELEAVTQK